MAKDTDNAAPEVQPPTEQNKGVLTDADKRQLNMAVLTEKTSVMDPTAHAQMKKVAEEFWNSGALNDSFANVNQVIMALAAGREMGMGFIESINGLYFVKGKLNIYGKATPSALRRHGWRIAYSEESQESCTATIRNIDTGEEITDTYTFEEAELSGFTKDKYGLKVGWKPGANRKRKLRYGVLSLIIHTYIPEVIGAAAGIAEYSQEYHEAAESTVLQTEEAAKADAKQAAAERIRRATEKAKELEDADS